MATGAYSIAFNEQLWFGIGTTSSTIPTSTAGLTRLTSLFDASMKGSSDKTDNIIDFDSTLGFGVQLIKTASYEIPLEMNLDPAAGAYQLLKQAWAGGPGGSIIRWYRQSPAVGGTASVNGEVNRGLGVIDGFEETRQAGEVITVSFNLASYGAPLFHYQGNPLATVTVTTNGSGLTPATYTAVPLVNVTAGGGIGGIATIVVAAGGTVTAAPTITTAGTNYKVGDVLTADLADIGGAAPDVAPTFTVATVTT